MAFTALLVTATCFSLVISEDTPRPERCDVPKKSQLEDKIYKLIAKLPQKQVIKDMKTELLPGAIFIGEGTVFGLEALKPDRPLKTFCRGDDFVTLFSLRARNGMSVKVPWKLCSGHNGTVTSSAVRISYEGEMVTSKTPDGGTESVIESLAPVRLETMSVGTIGGGEVLNTIVYGLGHVLSGPLRLFWVEPMTYFIRDVLQNALKEVN